MTTLTLVLAVIVWIICNILATAGTFVGLTTALRRGAYTEEQYATRIMTAFWFTGVCSGAALLLIIHTYMHG